MDPIESVIKVSNFLSKKHMPLAMQYGQDVVLVDNAEIDQDANGFVRDRIPNINGGGKLTRNEVNNTADVL